MNPPENYRVRYHAGEITPTRDGHRRHRRHGWAGRLGEDVALGYGRVAGVCGSTSRSVRGALTCDHQPLQPCSWAVRRHRADAGQPVRVHDLSG
jgi:hypothetical protein